MSWPASPDLLAPLAPWFDRVRRDLPWRAGDLDAPHPDPYAVLVSELMLQQTQVATVVPYFTRWMDRFPTPGKLAEAGEDAVHKAWEGLGYYRRARFLKAAAASIAAEGWPGDLDGLAGLPGLGPYTAAAVGSIAFQWPTPALDGNAFRVLARLLLIEGDPKAQAAETINGGVCIPSCYADADCGDPATTRCGRASLSRRAPPTRSPSSRGTTAGLSPRIRCSTRLRLRTSSRQPRTSPSCPEPHTAELSRPSPYRPDAPISTCTPCAIRAGLSTCCYGGPSSR